MSYLCYDICLGLRRRKEVTEHVSPPIGKDAIRRKAISPRSIVRTLSLAWLEKSGTSKYQCHF